MVAAKENRKLASQRRRHQKQRLLKSGNNVLIKVRVPSTEVSTVHFVTDQDVDDAEKKFQYFCTNILLMKLNFSMMAQTINSLFPNRKKFNLMNCCAGLGADSRAFIDAFPNCEFYLGATEKNKKFMTALNKSGFDCYDIYRRIWDIVICNPPFEINAALTVILEIIQRFKPKMLVLQIKSRHAALLLADPRFYRFYSPEESFRTYFLNQSSSVVNVFSYACVFVRREQPLSPGSCILPKFLGSDDLERIPEQHLSRYRETKCKIDKNSCTVYVLDDHPKAVLVQDINRLTEAFNTSLNLPGSKIKFRPNGSCTGFGMELERLLKLIELPTGAIPKFEHVKEMQRKFRLG